MTVDVDLHLDSGSSVSLFLTPLRYLYLWVGGNAAACVKRELNPASFGKSLVSIVIDVALASSGYPSG